MFLKPDYYDIVVMVRDIHWPPYMIFVFIYYTYIIHTYTYITHTYSRTKMRVNRKELFFKTSRQIKYFKFFITSLGKYFFFFKRRAKKLGVSKKIEIKTVCFIESRFYRSAIVMSGKIKFVDKRVTFASNRKLILDKTQFRIIENCFLKTKRTHLYFSKKFKLLSVHAMTIRRWHL